VRRLFPLLSLSVAALVFDDSAADVGAEDLSYHLAPIKARAKTRQGNVIEIERYGDIAQTRSASA
jgi:hypothetical protein